MERQLLESFPGTDVWRTLDDLRDDPIVRRTAKPWCLLPCGEYGNVVMQSAGATETEASPAQLLAAFHHWRYARSVYVIEPGLWERITSEPSVLGDLDEFQFPEWCVYLTVGGEAVGAWAHLLWDGDHQRPMLNLLMDIPEPQGQLEQVQAVTIPLGHSSLTEALAHDMFDGYAEQKAAGRTDVTEDEVRKGIIDLADALDGIVSVVAYLARPEADIAPLGDGRGPALPKRFSHALPEAHRRIWLVGYSLG